MACGKASGFTLAELMISVAMLTLLATFTVMSLLSSQRKEEVLAAARVLAADIRALQARALTAQDVKTCQRAAINITCETGITVCDVPASCAPAPPYAVGAYFVTGGGTYPFFADVDPSNNDSRDTAGANEEFFLRSLALTGSPHVIISDMAANGVSTTAANVAFARQNGAMTIHPCAGVCPTATTLNIVLVQQQTGDSVTVSLNAITGRVSVN